LSPGFGIDFGVFGTSANFERERHMAIAFSLRFMTGARRRTPRRRAARGPAYRKNDRVVVVRCARIRGDDVPVIARRWHARSRLGSGLGE
jgi:hypothetical protein